MQQRHNSADSIWKTINLLCLSFVAILIVVSAIVPNKVVNSSTMMFQLTFAGLVFWGTSRYEHRISSSLGIVLFQTARIVGMSSFLFQVMANFQHIIVEGWMDGGLLSVERSLTGVEASVFLQTYIDPFITEGLMFAYIMYVPLLPLVAIICYWSKGVRGAAEYLLNLTLAFLVCYAGFMLYPVASPLYHQPQLYNVDLHGGLFAWCAESIRHSQHYPGGSLPSTHCAAATIMIIMLFRHNRKAFLVLLPTLLSVYVATVYGRFHYAWDGIAAILTSSAAVMWGGHIVSAIDRVELRLFANQESSNLRTQLNERH